MRMANSIGLISKTTTTTTSYVRHTFFVLFREHMSLKKVPWDFCDDFKRLL